MNYDKIVESVKFLLKSVTQLSDRFVEANQGITNTFKNVFDETKEVRQRLCDVEEVLDDVRDQLLINGDEFRATPELPVAEQQKKKIFPSLNLPIESVLDVYRNTPALLEPFSKAL